MRRRHGMGTVMPFTGGKRRHHRRGRGAFGKRLLGQTLSAGVGSATPWLLDRLFPAKQAEGRRRRRAGKRRSYAHLKKFWFKKR